MRYRVIRQITYESDDEEVLREQIRRSLRVGKSRLGSVDIEVRRVAGMQWPTDGTSCYDGKTARPQPVAAPAPKRCVICNKPVTVGPRCPSCGVQHRKPKRVRGGPPSF